MKKCKFTIFLTFMAISTSFANSSNVVDKVEVLTPVPPPVKVGEKTFYVETFFEVDWFRAFQFCRFHGMQLASIESQEETDALTQTLNRTGLLNSYWTSGQNWSQNDTWVWLSNGNTAIYQNWRHGEPNNNSDNGEVEHCIDIRFVKEIGYQWNDLRCSVEEHFICEKI